jgi:DNA polymerase-3 subunit alpha
MAIQYLRDRYGADCVGNIMNLNRLGGREALKDAARTMRLPHLAVNAITTRIPTGQAKLPLRASLELAPGLKEEVDRLHPNLLATALAIEGVPRNRSVHAGGVVITPQPLHHYLPTFLTNPGETARKAKKQQVQVLQADMEGVEELLVKIDLLVVRTLDDLCDAAKRVEQDTGETIDLYRLGLNEPSAYQLIRTGRTDGIFQFGGSDMKQLLRVLQPTSVQDLALANALIRPGAEQGAGRLIRRRKGRLEPAKHDIALLGGILEETWGELVYQEQLIAIAQQVAGMSFQEADLIRKAAAKKKVELMAEQKKSFIPKAVQQGHAIEAVEALWRLFERSAHYNFNKAHALSYGLVGYWTAYMKALHPAHYMAAFLTRKHDSDHLTRYLLDTEAMGVKILPPDINTSGWAFEVEGDAIRFGLCAIKGLGEAAYRTIEKLREGCNQIEMFGRAFTARPTTPLLTIHIPDQHEPQDIDIFKALVQGRQSIRIKTMSGETVAELKGRHDDAVKTANEIWQNCLTKIWKDETCPE